MFLGRVRSGDQAVGLAARVEPGMLLRLDQVLEHRTDDPVALLCRYGLDGARELVRLAEERPAPGQLVREEDVTFEPPVPRPQKIICVALNYLAHADEGDQAAPEEPVIFFKPPSSLLGHRQPVRCPAQSQRVDYEVELAVVVGRQARDVPAGNWQDVVLGYTVLNDVTARDLQLAAIERNQPWDHSKAFDTFAPCGPYLVTPDEIPDPMRLDLSLCVGADVRQQSNTQHMIFSIPRLIETISAGITLEPGDIIATGTPAGIGPVGDGELMYATVEGVGTLVNPVVYEHRLVAAPA